MNYLYSYPHSGNSLLRYCYEYVTCTKSMDSTGKNPLIEKLLKNNSLKFHYQFEYKQQKATMHKRHWFKQPPLKDDKVVILIRNPLDLLFTNKQRRRRHKEIEIFKEIEDFYSYAKNFKNVMVIKYEDVISEKIADILIDMCLFFDVEINLENLNDLITNLDKHHKYSKYIYINIQHNTSYGKNIKYNKRYIGQIKKKINANNMISKYYKFD